MAPNLNKGKTEVMFAFRGSQSRTFGREFYSTSAGLPIVCERRTFHVPVVSRYLHLGGLIHHKDVNLQGFADVSQLPTQHFSSTESCCIRIHALTGRRDVTCSTPSLSASLSTD